MKHIKRWGINLTLAVFFCAMPAVCQAEEAISQDIYQWVQSTARQSYYFNKQVMHYGVDAEGFIDLDVLVIPTLHQYDSIQKEDVITKRRWKGLPVKGYDGLYGSADFVIINMRDGTVQVKEHEELDSNWGILSTMKSDAITSLVSLSDKSVDKKFYQSIIDYANTHQEELISHTKGLLRRSDKKKLDAIKKAKAKEEVRKNSGQMRRYGVSDTWKMGDKNDK